MCSDSSDLCTYLDKKDHKEGMYFRVWFYLFPFSFSSPNSWLICFYLLDKLLLMTFWNLKGFLLTLFFQSFRWLRFILLDKSFQRQLVHLNVFYLGAVINGCVLVFSLILKNICMLRSRYIFSFYTDLGPRSALYETCLPLLVLDRKKDPSAIVFWRTWI